MAQFNFWKLLQHAGIAALGAVLGALQIGINDPRQLLTIALFGALAGIGIDAETFTSWKAYVNDLLDRYRLSEGEEAPDAR